jgi:hypothetical protein
MIKRTIYCEKKGCNNFFTEDHENQGFPEWGQINGFIGKDKSGHELTITLCPKCLNEVRAWLTGQI